MDTHKHSLQVITFVMKPSIQMKDEAMCAQWWKKHSDHLIKGTVCTNFS